MTRPETAATFEFLMQPFEPRRILLASDHVPDLAEYITAKRPDLGLRVKPTDAVTAEDLGWADAYVGFRRPRPDGWGGVRWVHCIGAGVDGFVFDGPLPDGVLLTRSPEDFGPAIAEWCLARALAHNQHLIPLLASQRHRRWGFESESADPVPLRDQRVLVFGTGLVGRGIARGFAAMGCAVDGVSRTGRAATGFDHTFPESAFRDAIPDTDWLVLAAPLTRETRHFFDRDRLSLCGGAYLMNVGRGAVVDEGALPEALRARWISGAALDVFEHEPLPATSPLWGLEGVVIAPHNSGPSTVTATGQGFLECLSSIERGEGLKWLVNPELGY